MYFLALFQYGCPRACSSVRKKSMTSLCFPSGPEIRSGSIFREMLMCTQEVLWELGASFQSSTLSTKTQMSFKGHCAWKKLPPHCQTFMATILKCLPKPASLYTANVIRADYYTRVFCLCLCVRAHAQVCISERSCAR